MDAGRKRQEFPALVIEYTDPEEGFKGWLVIDSLDHNLCAGGMRVQPGLSREHLARMASNMTCKMRICGLRADGAKSGIDYDPAAPGKRAAMARFINAIKPYVRSRYSMGPDLNVEMTELESIGREIGLPSVKMAIAEAQGLDIAEFNERYRVLDESFEGWPLGKLRVGYGVAVATTAVIGHLGIPHHKASVVIQGFGALARAAAFGLARKGVRVVGIADHEKSIIDQSGTGLNIEELLATDGPLLPEIVDCRDIHKGASKDILSIPCDVFIPAAIENTVTEDVVPTMHAKAVVPGANLAVTTEADKLLFERNIIVLPDLLSGCGGSLSMEGLFAPINCPEPEEVLAHVEKRMQEMVLYVLTFSQKEKITPTRAAHRICAEIVPQPGTKPYGSPQ